MTPTRRQLQALVFGTGYVGLRSLASGLPVTFLGSGIARAAPAADPNFLILSGSSAGDPFNVHAPGAFVEGTLRGNNPALAASNVKLGAAVATGAKAWGELPDDLRARMSFIHHQTRTNAHPEFRNVQGLLGSAKAQSGNGQEMLASLVAQEHAQALGTIQVEPVPLSLETTTFDSRPLTSVKPADLKSLFESPEDLAATLQKLREQELDRMYAGLRQNGNRYQRAFLDRHALGREQARQLGDDLGSLLARLPTDATSPNSTRDQLLTAVALIKLKVAPTMTVKLPFGGDNHKDSDLAIEDAETLLSIGDIAFLWNELKTNGLQDWVTFAQLNVFGRTLKRNSMGGRDHNGKHHVTMMFGPKVRGSVIGGLVPDGSDFAATGFDSQTGLPSADGDIQPDVSLESCAKTLVAALGLGTERMEFRIRGGKVIAAALQA